MQVGDLVRMSAYGSDRKGNDNLDACGYGIVTSHKPYSWCDYPYTTIWYDRHGNEQSTTHKFHRREIKKYKPDKN